MNYGTRMMDMQTEFFMGNGTNRWEWSLLMVIND